MFLGQIPPTYPSRASNSIGGIWLPEHDCSSLMAFTYCYYVLCAVLESEINEWTKSQNSPFSRQGQAINKYTHS